jgi:hypothetical protein
MVTAADLTVRLPAITKENIEDVIRRMCRKRVTVSAAAARLGFADWCPSSGPATVPPSTSPASSAAAGG